MYWIGYFNKYKLTKVHVLCELAYLWYQFRVKIYLAPTLNLAPFLISPP